MSVGELLYTWAEKRPDQLCCTISDRRFTFAEMSTRADQLAAGLERLGVGKGDRVATLATNRAEILELFYGLARAGAVQVPLNAYLKGTFLRHQLRHSRARVLIVDAPGRIEVQGLLGELPDLELIVRLDPRTGETDLRGRDEVPYEALSVAGALPPEIQVRPEDTMSIVYTSGTTGMPKGCVLSHGYYTRSGRLNGDALELGDGDALYSALPLYHAGGRLIVLMSGLYRGLPVHLDPAFSARGFFRRAAETDATVAIGVGAMGAALLATAPGPNDRKHRLRTMMVSPMSVCAQDEFRERFGIEPWTEVFGQTECMPLAFTPISSATRDRSGCGTVAPDLEMALLGDTTEPVAEGQIGEICVRPKHSPFAMFDGYWDQPDETQHAQRGAWYHTGDYGRLLPSGSLAFVDRKKDCLRRRGENVSSLELEAAINSHPDIVESAVHAVPSELAEDDIKACLVVRVGAALEPAGLFRFLQEHLPYYALPRYIEIVDALPRNAVGRVMKHVLRDRHLTDPVWDFDRLGLAIAPHTRR
jgi:crotonobetaine/carnitine-CoA ligase